MPQTAKGYEERKVATAAPKRGQGLKGMAEPKPDRTKAFARVEVGQVPRVVLNTDNLVAAA